MNYNMKTCGEYIGLEKALRVVGANDYADVFFEERQNYAKEIPNPSFDRISRTLESQNDSPALGMCLSTDVMFYGLSVVSDSQPEVPAANYSKGIKGAAQRRARFLLRNKKRTQTAVEGRKMLDLSTELMTHSDPAVRTSGRLLSDAAIHALIFNKHGW